ncbi:MAG: hypothetical protein LRY57_04285 [Alphaproteobacteria bacterium]|nr:hypothetical protein [Alphaproteobacteria bacterium]
MRQEVAEETADQKTEQVISYERIERQVEEVEKKADQRQGLKKTVRARLEDTGLAWFLTGLPGVRPNMSRSLVMCRNCAADIKTSKKLISA